MWKKDDWCDCERGMVFGVSWAEQLTCPSESADRLGFPYTPISKVYRENSDWQQCDVNVRGLIRIGRLLWADVDDVLVAHLGPLVFERYLIAAAYLSIFHSHKTRVFPSSNGWFDQDNAPCHKSWNHSKLVSWTLQWVHSTVTRSTSNRAPLACCGGGRLAS